MRSFLVALGVIFTLGFSPAEAVGRSQPMQFVFQSMGQPYQKWDCTYQKDANLPYDYTVACPVTRKTRNYRVHLAIAYYPKTRLGLSAYEILYWVTDFTDPSHPTSHSSTTWIHQDTQNVRPTVFQLSQGVDNDLAALQLTVDNR